jgi:CRP/FNR family transcriptional regulator, cyclic AMP receptor protein
VAKKKTDAALAAIPLFDTLTKRHLKKVASLGTVTKYMPGHSIVRQGEPGENFFVVLEGQARVQVGGRTVNRLIPGDHFGEVSLLDGGVRSATVESETPMRLFEISRPAFMKTIEHDGDLALALLSSLARTIRRVDRSIGR